jgi:hypothetical protein
MHACTFFLSVCMCVRTNVCIGAISCRAAHAPARLCVVSADEVAGTRSQKYSLYCVHVMNVLGHLLFENLCQADKKARSSFKDCESTTV